MSRTHAIQRLRERVGAVGSLAAEPRTVALVTGGTLRLGAVHEWFGPGQRPDWSPPLCILADTAQRAVHSASVHRILWVGRACWPHPHALGPDVLAATIFLDPADDAARLWAIDVALRCSSPLAVVADGRGLTLAHTRRLQLAAGAGGGTCLLARPRWELDHLSAATTRWGVTPAATSGGHPRWTAALLRDKDRPVNTDDPPRWIVEWDGAQGLVCIPTAVAPRTGRAAALAS